MKNYNKILCFFGFIVFTVLSCIDKNKKLEVDNKKENTEINKFKDVAQVNHDLIKQRFILMADIGHDPDDEQQLTHLLMYSNKFDLEGLIAVTGRYFRPNPKDTVKVLMPELFHYYIDGYEKVYPNLKLHESGWKTPKYLHSVVASGQEGNGMKDVGAGRTSDGAKCIMDAVLKDDDRPIFVLSNGGMNTLAQALYTLREKYSKEELKVFISKLRVFDNSGQDESGAWICHEFPDLFYIRATHQNKSFGGPSNSNLGPHVWQPYEYSPNGQHQWFKENVQTNHGELGTLYPDRKVDKTYHFIGGGGTIPWLVLVNPALSDISEPSWGGWGGRYSAQKMPNLPSGFSIVEVDEQAYLPYKAYGDGAIITDTWKNPDDAKVYSNEYTPAWRWREAVWNDLKARMDWCIQPFSKANHRPVAVLNGDSSNQIVKAKYNYHEEVVLDATGSKDPDGDNLSYKWWVYHEAGKKSYNKPIKIKNDTSIKTSFKIPIDAATKELHVILEVRDDNSIVPMVDYKRMIIIVTNY
ncbi:nucleoside hydrolase-like domain-containing protein [uncultured Maribacter sp.]|uniref:nucleoside hydrolase-like domain-containing protein n=1 Tax=uncultured Maribacter sp. TaxID=431308 RepID=UPI00260E0051|nr:nucleoside hydrolase-like domain-containing protein [uncultured Maribacter sp.]